MPEDPGAVRSQEQMREHEREAQERSEHEREDPERTDDERDPLGTPEDDAMPAPPGNVQGANLGGAS